jgi:hypothetical protein
MRYKKEKDLPKNLELWVTPTGERRLKARTLAGAYKTDVNRSMRDLGKFLRTRWPDKFKIDIVEIP